MMSEWMILLEWEFGPPATSTSKGDGPCDQPPSLFPRPAHARAHAPFTANEFSHFLIRLRRRSRGALIGRASQLPAHHGTEAGAFPAGGPEAA
jgi:hypothetical protein